MTLLEPGTRLVLDCSCEAEIDRAFIPGLPRHCTVQVRTKGPRCGRADHFRHRALLVSWHRCQERLHFTDV